MSDQFSAPIFLRIMKLPADRRRDLLEFLGQSTLSEQDLEDLLSRIERAPSVPIRQFG